jgi:uridine kinase
VGAGKSTLARQLAGESQGITISTDHYLPDYTKVSPARRDEPEEADLPELAAHLALLKGGQPAEIPVWSFQSHRREATQLIQPADLVIVEGLFALHPRIAPWADLLVYVHAEPSTRWSRWEAIELRGERGMGVEKARQHFDSIAEPTFAKYAHSYRAAAHLIVTTDNA